MVQIDPTMRKTLNMMRPTHINPKISANTYLQGIHDFNRVPFPHPRILTVIHESPDSRETYAPHGLKGCYVGGSPEHYRCFDIWCPDTRQVCHGETVSLPPHEHVLPGLFSHENITRSIRELIAALQHPHPASPTAQYGIEQTQALIQLSRIMQLALPVPKPATPTIPPMNRWLGLPDLPPRVPVPTAPHLRGYQLPPTPEGANCSPTSKDAILSHTPEGENSQHTTVAHATSPTPAHPHIHAPVQPNMQPRHCPRRPD